jgi:hypothetical protein
MRFVFIGLIQPHLFQLHSHGCCLGQIMRIRTIDLQVRQARQPGNPIARGIIVAGSSRPKLLESAKAVFNQTARLV